MPIGGRAFEIIELLVDASNGLVPKDELMSRIWPGAVVEDNTLQVHISAIRKALGDNRGLLQAVHGRGYRLLGRWTRRSKRVPTDRAVPQPAAGDATTTNLPISSSELIGRNDAIRYLDILTSAYRVVTLTGPGGIGKTRLALEVARQQSKTFKDGAHLIEFAAASDAALVPTMVAAALGLRLVGNEMSAAAVAQSVGNRAMLLVLDNCEHLIDAAARMAEALVLTCPNISILATSRELLRIDGECVYRVPPLSLPPEDIQAWGEMLRYGAMQLFAARLHASGSYAAAEGQDLQVIGAICRRLDGIPLAIEFAAARVAMLGVETVFSLLEDRFALLTSGRRTALPRHQTLGAVLDWSYQLLSEPERQLLRRLAVFADGFTRDAIIAVMPLASSADVIAGLSNLVLKSLVSLDVAQQGGRWNLLETTRAYALKKLHAAAEAQETARLHALFFRDWAERRPMLHTAPGSLARYGREISNVRAALDWAFSDQGDADIGSALTAAYVPVWLHLGLVPECREAVRRAVERDNAGIPERVQMRLNIAHGLLVAYTPMSHSSNIEDILLHSLRTAEQLDDLESQLLALWGLSTVKMKHGDHRAGQEIAERIRMKSLRGDAADKALGDRAVGTASYYAGNQLEARSCLERILELPMTAAREDYEAWLLTDLRIQSEAMLARVLLLQGCIDQAQKHAQICFEQARNADRAMSICFTLRYAVCGVSLTLGDIDTAEPAVSLLVEVATRHRFNPWIKLGDCLQGMLAIRQGDLANGTTRLRKAIDANMQVGFTLCYPEMLGFLASGLITLGQHDEARATLRSAVDWSDHTGERWYLPELWRLQGDLALQGGIVDGVEAEAAFSRAISLAQKQGARLWELRAACSLTRLKMAKGQPTAALQTLAPVFAQFQEGDGSEDLRIAHGLLDDVTQMTET